jgi:hypothetical protein
MFRARSFPYEDAALFEYVGRAIVHGGRLYVDIWDNKLPSIYLVNALWQLLFGEHYGLHKLAEVAVNALSVGLFAVVLRIMGVKAWAPAICALAWTLALATVLDAAEYYALPCILLAYALALSRSSAVGAGAALAIATSFWIPSLLLVIPLLADSDSKSTRRSLIVGFTAAAVLYASAMIALSGFATIVELVHSWCSYLTFTRTSERPFVVRFLAGITWSGVGILFLVFAMLVRKPRTKRERFGLWWACCALAGAVGPLNFYPHYFVPSLPPLIFCIASFRSDWRVMRPRMAFASLAVVLAATIAIDKMKSLTPSIFRSDASTVAVGERIRQAFGNGSVIYSPDYAPEIYLAANAALTNRFALAGPANVGFMRSQAGFRSRTPIAILELSRNHVRKDVYTPYIQVCAQRPFSTWTVYVTSAVASKFDCG